MTTFADDSPIGAHFTAGEMGIAGPDIPPDVAANVRQRLVPWLEAARVRFGNQAIIISPLGGYRSPTVNAATGGASLTSDHPNGLAADFSVRGVSQLRQYELLRSGGFPRWDQIIFYPLTGHTHVGLGPRMRGEIRIKLAEPGYPILTPALVSKLRTGAPIVLAVLAVGLLLLAAAQKGA